MDIGKLMARTWSVNDELQERTTKLITQCYCRDKEQRGYPSGASAFRQQEQPENCEDHNADGFPIEIGQKGKHHVEQPVPDPLIEEEEQFPVNPHERIQQSGIPFDETAQVVSCELLLEFVFL